MDNNQSLVGKILEKPLDVLICTQKFGERPEVYKNYGSPKGHNGLDFRTKSKTDPNDWKRPVYSVMDGFVKEARFEKLKGNYVRINHPNGYQSVYLHLDALSIKENQNVRARDRIGVSGNTGVASEAPHLHFCYRPVNYDSANGYMGYIDPTSYFKDEIQFV